MVITRSFKLAGTTLILFFMFVPLVPTFAVQNDIELLISHFEGDSTPQYKNLDRLISQKLKGLFSMSRQYGITAKVWNGSVYRLKGELWLCTIENEGSRLYVSYELTDAKSNQLRKFGECDTIQRRELEALSADVAKIIWEGLQEVLTEDSTFIYIAKFITEDDNLNSLIKLSDLLPQSIDRELKQHDSQRKFTIKTEESVYLLVGSFKKDDYVYIDYNVWSMDSYEAVVKNEARFVKYQKDYVAEIAAQKLFDDIVFGLLKNVRIAVADFSMLGHDKMPKTLKSLERAIPMMLKNGLKISPQLTIVEEEHDPFIQRIIKAQRQRGIIDVRTLPELGRILHPDYLITGQFWQLGEKIGVEVQCMNISTGETIVSEGISIQHIDVDTIHARISALASNIRQGIAKDVMREKTRQTISVVGVPPIPDTKDNRRRAEHLIRAISRKLKTVDTDELKIEESRQKIADFIRQPANAWAMATDLDVDILFMVQYEDHGEGDITVDAEMFDRARPHANVYNKLWYRRSTQIDEVADEIAVSFLQTLGVPPSNLEKNKDDRRGIRVRRLERPFSIGTRFGVVLTTVGGPLENSQNQSFDIFFSFPLDRNHHWKLGTLITWDWGNRTWENVFLGTRETSMHLFSSYLTMKYYFLPERSFNPYAGVGVGLLLLRRIRDEEGSLLAAPGDPRIGVTALFGFEIFSNRKLFLAPQVKVFYAFSEVDEETYKGQHFNSGILKGVNIGLGIGYKW